MPRRDEDVEEVREEPEDLEGEDEDGEDDDAREGGRDEGRARDFKHASEAVRRALMSGLRSVLSSEDGLRGVVSEALPKEAIGYIMRQVDAGKDEVVRIIGLQVKKFLDNLDLSGELQKLLTSVSFEIKTEIRFIPNDQAIVKPQARIRSRVKQTTGDKGRGAGAAREGAPREPDRADEERAAGEDKARPARAIDESVPQMARTALRSGVKRAVDYALGKRLKDEPGREPSEGDEPASEG